MAVSLPWSRRHTTQFIRDLLHTFRFPFLWRRVHDATEYICPQDTSKVCKNNSKIKVDHEKLTFTYFPFWALDLSPPELLWGNLRGKKAKHFWHQKKLIETLSSNAVIENQISGKLVVRLWIPVCKDPSTLFFIENYKDLHHYVCLQERCGADWDVWANEEGESCMVVSEWTWELMILCEDRSMLAGRPKNAGLSSSGRFSTTLR